METNQEKLVEENESSKKKTESCVCENNVKFTPFQYNVRYNATGFTGVQKTRVGKFVARIRDPIKKKMVHVGTFNTPQEAANAFLLKKQVFLDTHQYVKKPSKGLVGIYKAKNGRYCASITNPITHKTVWLGTFHTVEEASQAYFSKKSEFEKLVQVNRGKEPIICVESSKEASCLMASVRGTKSSNRCIYTVTSYPKAKRSLLRTRGQKNGWNADVVRDLIRCEKRLLGTSNTKNCDQIETESPVGASLSVDNDQALNVASVGRNKTTSSHETTHIVGVGKSKSGRFFSEIWDPINKKSIWLGTFDTAEEASQAFQSKKLEFQKLVKAKQQYNRQTHSSAREKQDGKVKFVNIKQGQETVNLEGFQLKSACGTSYVEIDIPLTNSSEGESDQRIDSHEISHSMGVQMRKSGIGTSDSLLGTLSTAEEDSNAYQCKKMDFERSKKAELQNNMPTGPCAGEKQECQEDEDLWKGQWVQVPGNKEIIFSVKLGVPIIDNYGSLLGEFRKLDDLRIR